MPGLCGEKGRQRGKKRFAGDMLISLRILGQEVRWSSNITPRSSLRRDGASARWGQALPRGVGMTAQRHVSLLLPKGAHAPVLPCPFLCRSAVPTRWMPRKTRSHVCPVACGSACCCPSAAFNAHRTHCLTLDTLAVLLLALSWPV